MNLGASAGLIIGLIVGCALAAQGAMNAKLADQIGGALPAATWSFSVGLLTLLLIYGVLNKPIPSISDFQSAPWWALLGGLAGASVVTGAAFFVPKIGVTTWLGAIIAGQLVAAILIDHFGALGTEVRQINLTRIGGAVLLGLGVWLVQKGGQQGT
ncbi:DMT family transporter [Parvularcula sp. ZS-1/3]|uniref:DMT family transporter n=1 Tax=Parvularcula mediterranea TaxID=2732508 RepID=A0A7Y3RN44_9PROT|nr:DMT family transporter [Parvularcula mediterranea]NNU17128.1 DMT family transporter [Parvularcula mediterranea]